METRFGQVNVTYSARGVPTYRVEASHDGLHRYEVVRGGDPDTLTNKVRALALRWNETWKKQCAAESRIHRAFEAREARRLRIEHQKDIAHERTAEAQQLLETLRNLLTAKIEEDPTLNWEQLKVKEPFSASVPEKPNLPTEPVLKRAPPAPERSGVANAYRVELSILDRLIPSRRQSKIAAARSRFDADMTAWRAVCAALSDEYSNELDVYTINRNKLQEEYAQATAKWEEEKKTYYEGQAKQHAEVDEFHKRYESKSPDAVVEYCERVLLISDYPDCVPREFELDLNEAGVLVLNCRLPAPQDLPRLHEVKYVQTTDTLSERFFSEAESARLYDDLVYQITLRTIHELFQSDFAKAISTVVFNGIVTSISKSTGHETTACILSVQVPRETFLGINLAKVDPKACFKQLKGVGSSKLHSVTPIAPLIELKRDDRRFVPSYPVAERLNEGNNLAAMDWEDFEHLIREIFEKEFSSGGGEVKVTQASRDGGVDAIAFDPDPIRGGKIVIQAKRYAYTVGVSAVRDLYGTVLNEGASKGILVTTSDYGPDAYEFAAGKPLTLLNGSNLLYLLGRHGISAHIDLTEARKIARERFDKSDSPS